jgi:hypothetical protein
MRGYFRLESEATIPDNVNVSCGFPGGGSARKRIGECWSSTASKAGKFEIFISPVLDDAGIVLDVLVHEMVHAAVGTECGHTGAFRKVAKALGLEGKMTATKAGPKLQAQIANWIDALGPYPHGAINLSNRKKQSTRLVKCECGSCGYIVRTTAKWIEQAGAVICPCNGQQMHVAGSEEESEDSDGE